MDIRVANDQDAPALLDLYRKVAAFPGGLSRLEAEITPDYIQNFLSASMARGLIFVAVSSSAEIAGEIHAYSPGQYCFAHVLSELTIAVDPRAQGVGVGRKLLQTLMQEIERNLPDILRVELIARASNEKAILFYESLGFEREGEFRNRIKNVDGTIESDIPMAWTRA